jgi:hypothetical protein
MRAMHEQLQAEDRGGGGNAASVLSVTEVLFC